MITTYNNPLRNFWDIWNNKSLRNFGIVGFFWNRMGNSWFVKFLNRVPFFYVTWWFRQKLFSTEAFTHQKNAQQFFSTQKVLRTEVLRTEGFTHNIFYIQTLLRTDVFTRTQIADRNLCTQCAFTQPTFTQRGCASPSWSPTFRVPPLKYFLDTECFSFWKPWFWTCPAWLITNTLKLRPALRWRQWVAHYGTYIEDLFYCTY